MIESNLKKKTKPDLMKSKAVSKNSLLMSLWDESLNDIHPDDVSMNSGTKAWWRCPYGHSFKRRISSQNSNKSYCPQCKIKINSLAKNFPELSKEWHPNKNNSLTPENVTFGQTTIVWWKCDRNHTWKQNIGERTKRSSGCPSCRKQEYYQKTGKSLSRRDRKLFDGNKNELPADEITLGMRGKYWWRCKEGHSWQQSVNNRSNSKHGCPQCHSISNSLSKRFPEVYSMIDFSKEEKEVSLITPGSDIVLWWKCDRKHSFQKTVRNQVNNRICPECSPRRGPFSLPAELHKEWHPNKNDGLLPEQFSRGSHRIVWWRCEDGHEWQARISSRAQSGSSCKLCMLNPISDFPYMIENWDYQKNALTSPAEVGYTSRTKYWWKCSEGHEWQTSPDSMEKIGGCCKKCFPPTRGFDPTKPGFLYLLSDGNDSLKVGITNQLSRRLRAHRTAGFTIIHQIIKFEKGMLARNSEKRILKFVKDKGYSPTIHKDSMPRGGYTETFAAEALPDISLNNFWNKKDGENITLNVKKNCS